MIQYNLRPFRRTRLFQRTFMIHLWHQWQFTYLDKNHLPAAVQLWQEAHHQKYKGGGAHELSKNEQKGWQKFMVLVQFYKFIIAY